MTQRLHFKISYRVFLTIAVYILLFGFTLRIVNLSKTSLWIDDILTYSTLQQADSLDGFLQGMIERKLHVPAYFAVSSLYPGDHNDFSLRYPNVLWSMLAIAMIIRLTGGLYQRRELGLLAGILLVIHPHFILISREARPYPMGIFFTTASSYLFLRWLDARTHHTRQTLVFGLMSLITYLTHYATLILIPAQLGYILWRKITKKESSRTLILWMVIQCIAVLPTICWEVLILAPRRSASVLTWVLPVTPESLWAGVAQLYIGLFPPHTPTVFQIFALLLGLVGFLWYLRQTRYGVYWLLLTIAPIIGIVIVSLIRPLFYARYLSVMQSFYLLTLLLGWWHIWRHLKAYRIVQWGLVLVIGLAFINALAFSAGQFQTQSFARREWREVMAYIEAQAQPDDVIITHPSYVLAPEHYQTRDDIVILQPDEITELINNYFVTDTPLYQRMWFIITPEGFQLQAVANYYGVDEQLTSYSTRLLFVEN